MNKYIQAIKDLDLPAVEQKLASDPKWLTWAEDDGKNALHYLGGVVTTADAEKEKRSLEILKLLLKNGMDINSIHQIPDERCTFPATPLWYAYTRGRNKSIYTYLLENGADPENCMFAIAWYDDAEAAALFKNHDATIDDFGGRDTPFLAAFTWRKFAVAEWFLKNGADVNFADVHGNTALYYAVKRRFKDEQIEMLLKFNADVDKENNEGMSPKKFALENRRRNVLKLFERY